MNTLGARNARFADSVIFSNILVNDRGTYSGKEGGDTEYFDDTLEHDLYFF